MEVEQKEFEIGDNVWTFQLGRDKIYKVQEVIEKKVYSAERTEHGIKGEIQYYYKRQNFYVNGEFVKFENPIFRTEEELDKYLTPGKI